MEQLFSAGKAYLKINSLVKTPLHEFMAVESSGLWAPDSVHVRRNLPNLLLFLLLLLLMMMMIMTTSMIMIMIPVSVTVMVW